MTREFVEVIVRQGGCPCPGAPHLTESVWIEPELTLPIAAAATAAMEAAPENTVADQEAALIEAYLPRAIRRWTFQEAGEDGRTVPVPITRDNLERLVPWDMGGLDLAERCDTLYSARLMRPLVARLSMLSAPTSMDGSTSATPQSGSPIPPSSLPSSPEDVAGLPSGVPVP